MPARESLRSRRISVSNPKGSGRGLLPRLEKNGRSLQDDGAIDLPPPRIPLPRQPSSGQEPGIAVAFQAEYHKLHDAHIIIRQVNSQTPDYMPPFHVLSPHVSSPTPSPSTNINTYLPNRAPSTDLSTKYTTAVNPKAISIPTSPPASPPQSFPTGPTCQLCAMPNAVPRIPNPTATAIAYPGGNFLLSI